MKVFLDSKYSLPGIKCGSHSIKNGNSQKYIMCCFDDGVWIHGTEETTDVVLDKFADSTFSLSKSGAISSILINIIKGRISFWHRK